MYSWLSCLGPMIFEGPGFSGTTFQCSPRKLHCGLHVDDGKEVRCVVPGQGKVSRCFLPSLCKYLF